VRLIHLSRRYELLLNLILLFLLPPQENRERRLFITKQVWRGAITWLHAELVSLNKVSRYFYSLKKKKKKRWRYFCLIFGRYLWIWFLLSSLCFQKHLKGEINKMKVVVCSCIAGEISSWYFIYLFIINYLMIWLYYHSLCFYVTVIIEVIFICVVSVVIKSYNNK